MRFDERMRRGEWLHWLQSALALSILVVAGCGAEDGYGGGGQGGAAGGGGGGAANVVDLPADEAGEFIVAAPSNSVACTSGAQCPTGFCVDGFCCDTKCDNKCMACSAAKKGSGANGICGSIAYDTDPDGECPQGRCDGKNQCKFYNGYPCTSTAQCLSNYCVDGFCCGNICMGACQACSAAKKGIGVNGVCGNIAANTNPDGECASGGTCNGSGACSTSITKLANGAACTSAAQCNSGFCADGVCCDSWCLGTCQACTAARKGSGSDGTCGNIANDRDPDDECWGGACDGKGVCKQYNGVPCSTTAQCLSGYCVDGFCCGNICTGTCQACSEAKKGQGFDGVCGVIMSGRDPDSECNPGECNGSGTCNQPQTPQANGTACVSAGQCASGNCVDGFCCDSACTGTCQACSAAKKGTGANGACGDIVAETDPDEECGIGGRCGGSGTCRLYNGAACTANAQCFSNYCVDGFCCNNICTSSCFACSAAKKGQGADGTCGAIANTRDPDNECNPGECNGSGACNQAQAPQANGATCALGSQCTSGFCVDGVCCNAACTGTCQACSAAKKGSGTNGTCGNIKYDTDPDEECFGGACDGLGVCEFYNGLACTSNAQCLSSYCVDGFCCNNLCSGTCQACSAAKKGSGIDGACGLIASNTDPDNECATGNCNGAGVCTTLAANGAACSTAAQCASNFCVSGVCCNSACSGMCDTCNAAGSVGTCTQTCVGPCTGTVGLPGAPLALQNVSLAGDNVAIDAADFNKDGRQDLVAVTSSGSVSVLLGQANKTFGAPTTLAAAADAMAVATGDLNADTFVDIVVANKSTGVSVFLNQGNGTFAAKVDYATGMVDAWFNEPDMLRIADVNGDGVLDVATANRSASTVSLLLGQGNGTFPNKIDVPAASRPTALVVANLNGDAFVDLAVATFDSANFSYRVSVMLGQGGGAFGAPVHYNVVDRSSTSLTAADLDGDGRLDLVHLEDEFNTGQVHVLLNQGNGTFANAVSYVVSGHDRVIAGNLNGDAIPDVMVATGMYESVAVLVGQTGGTLAAPIEYPTQNDAFSLVAADFDNDGDRDIVTANLDSLSVLDNPGTGTLGNPVNANPKISVAGTWLRSRDMNNDGTLDLVTINEQLSTYTVTVSLGQAGGTFTPGTAQALISSIAMPQGYELGNLNGDGRADLVACTQWGISSPNFGCYVWFAQSDGTFGSRTEYAVGSTSFALVFQVFGPVLGDFDGNGTLDLAAMGYMYDTHPSGYIETLQIHTWLNPGTGQLGAANVQSLFSKVWGSNNPTPSQFPRGGVAGGDWNGDGRMDLAVSERTLAGTRILLSQGNGQFTVGALLPESTEHHAADVNGDGAVDLLGRIFSNNIAAGTNLWVNTGSGTFAAGVAHAEVTSRVETGDLNGDGARDLVFVTGGNKVGVKLNQGGGVFGSTRVYLTGVGPVRPALGDWNKDGRVDVAVQNAVSSSITIHSNSCLP